MATGKERAQRETRDRTRTYQARQDYQAGRGARRRRDNLIAGIGGGILILGLIGIQTAYFVAGPGAPEPAPTSTSTPAPTSEPTPTPAPTSEPTPESSP